MMPAADTREAFNVRTVPVIEDCRFSNPPVSNPEPSALGANWTPKVTGVAPCVKYVEKLNVAGVSGLICNVGRVDQLDSPSSRM